jgi:hypothetical protein
VVKLKESAQVGFTYEPRWHYVDQVGLLKVSSSAQKHIDAVFTDRYEYYYTDKMHLI